MTTGISDRFKRFAVDCTGSSRLYERLSLEIAEDDKLLQMAAHCRAGQPEPNLFFGAVHCLLLKGYDDDLKAYYASIVNDPREPETAFPYFKRFCLEHEHEIIPLLQSKLVQTNEVRRCAYMYPAFCYIFEKARKPLALIELGTSAGLQLFWDKYGYAYNDHERYGDAASELVLRSEIRGGNLPYLLKDSPPVTARIGIDLHVNDLEDAEDYLWLRSLIWPEHKERITNFEKAALYFEKQAIQLIEGNGVKLLAETAAMVPEGSALCVFHTHVANQMSNADKAALIATIQKLGKERDVFHLYNNMYDLNLHLDYYLGSKEYMETIAEADGHGRWFHWMV
ncbi:DUF2332 domain-containing protein [Paenibacillus sp. FJAT-27812]|uniref:DUF2332 domain-containing protein n=1 Tax=Paenibacillus sp. FJAT-27812 TaxID=1684143 RepID=UPI0006A7BA2B|nr:DUF2332 domain-containing protein [Paenibacillus sp. FJAT-27812]